MKKALITIITLFSFNANALERYTVSNIVDKIQPSVVTVKAIGNTPKIITPSDKTSKINPFDKSQKKQALDNIYNANTKKSVKKKNFSIGSGVFVGEEGYIITNYHVIDMADIIEITTSNNKTYNVDVVGFDTKSDLALLEIQKDYNFKIDSFVKFADSDKVRVGEFVIAVGNPYGLNGSVSSGIISARNRNIGANIYDDFLQTDASINPGNSGGPLFNLDGEVIGINTAIFSNSGDSNGIGFAIPSNTVKSIIKQLKENGEVIRGWLGIETLVTEENSVKQILITDVVINSPADMAGLMVDDVILEYKGTKIKTLYDLPRLVADTKINSQVDIKVLRNGKELDLKVTISSANSFNVVLN